MRELYVLYGGILSFSRMTFNPPLHLTLTKVIVMEVYTLFALTVTLRYEKTPVGPEHIHSGPTGVFFDHGIAASE